LILSSSDNSKTWKHLGRRHYVRLDYDSHLCTLVATETSCSCLNGAKLWS